MIGWLKGRVLDKHQPGKFVLDVQGVGYDVETSLSTFFQLEAQSLEVVALHIHTIVREDALLLYGFIDHQERSLFRALIKVNGVGPKLAMAILSSISPQDFIQCIHQENTAVLVKLPGIGKKTAERLLVEMKDNLHQWADTATRQQTTAMMGVNSSDEAISALEALGYKRAEALKAIRALDDETLTCEQLIRRALQTLAMRTSA